MALTSVLAGAIAISSSAAAAAASDTPLWEYLLIVASLLAALTTIWKFTHISNVVKRARQVSQAWFGEPAAPGVERRPGLPETVAKIASQVHEINDALPALTDTLDTLKEWAEENGNRINLVDSKLTLTDSRITDHARRNEEQAKILRVELERRAAALEEKLHDRNDTVDRRLESLSQDLLRAETYRAALVELGYPITEPPKQSGSS